MSAGITEDCRAVWLDLRRDGGWWSVAALVHHWRPTFVGFELEDILAALVAGGFLQMREQLGEVQYCHTSDCRALPGMEAATA